MRTLLVTGPGGAGSSTVAAATALAAAEAGARVALLCSSAPAVAGLADLVRVEVVHPQPALESAWAGHAAALAALVPALTVPPASSVVPLPGTAEVAQVLALGALAAAGDTDVVVVDPGPLPTATALLALPGTLRWWAAQLAPPRLRVLAAMGALVAGGRATGTAAALAGISTLEGLLDRVPRDPAVHLVLPPVPGADGVLRGAGTGFGLLGHPVASVTLARMLPAGAGEWATRRAGQQEDVRRVLDATGLTLREVPEAAVSPRDLVGLRTLGAAVPTDPAVPLPVRVARREGPEWVLPVALPFAARGTVGLTRWGDDLVLTLLAPGGSAGPLRRSVPLDPLLRRCTVTAGTLDDPGTAAATLRIRFIPDRAQWPAGLLTTERSTA